MSDWSNNLTRREWLENAGAAAAMAGPWPAGMLERFAAEPLARPPDGAKETLDALLNKHRNRVLAADGRIGGTLAHVPLALMALYRIGASPEQMQRFFGDDGRAVQAPPAPGKESVLTVESWRSSLRQGVSFSRWFAFFDGWLKEANGAETGWRDRLDWGVRGREGGGRGFRVGRDRSFFFLSPDQTSVRASPRLEIEMHGDGSV